MKQAPGVAIWLWWGNFNYIIDLHIFCLRRHYRSTASWRQHNDAHGLLKLCIWVCWDLQRVHSDAGNLSDHFNELCSWILPGIICNQYRIPPRIHVQGHNSIKRASIRSTQLFCLCSDETDEIYTKISLAEQNWWNIAWANQYFDPSPGNQVSFSCAKLTLHDDNGVYYCCSELLNPITRDCNP